MMQFGYLASTTHGSYSDGVKGLPATVVHFQGCTLGCPGCFNPQTHDRNSAVFVVTPVEFVWRHALEKSTEVVALSGGEPFQQPNFLLAALQELAAASPYTYVICYTGFYEYELEKIPAYEVIKDHGLIDVLISGRFDAEKLVPIQEKTGASPASTNQRMIFLTDRLTEEDFRGSPTIQMTIDEDADVHVTGFPTKDLLEEMTNE